MRPRRTCLTAKNTAGKGVAIGLSAQSDAGNSIETRAPALAGSLRQNPGLSQKLTVI
jgi:hypothetical protein